MMDNSLLLACYVHTNTITGTYHCMHTVYNINSHTFFSLLLLYTIFIYYYKYISSAHDRH